MQCRSSPEQNPFEQRAYTTIDVETPSAKCLQRPAPHIIAADVCAPCSTLSRLVKMAYAVTIATILVTFLQLRMSYTPKSIVSSLF